MAPEQAQQPAIRRQEPFDGAQIGGPGLRFDRTEAGVFQPAVEAGVVTAKGTAVDVVVVAITGAAPVEAGGTAIEAGAVAVEAGVVAALTGVAVEAGAIAVEAGAIVGESWTDHDGKQQLGPTFQWPF